MLLHDGDPGRVAVVVPDLLMSVERPVLHLTMGLLMESGWTVRLVDLRGRRTPEEIEQCAAAELDQDGDSLRLVVGFSAGTAAAPVAVDRNLPAVWIRPLLRDDRVCAALAATLEPGLLVGGTGDAQWDEGFARSTRLQVHSVDDADPSLEIPGSIKDTLKSLSRTLRRIEDFIRGLER